LRRTRWALLPALALLAASCGTSTQMTESWREPSYQPQPVSKVMVIGIGENPLRVKVFEDIMGQKFAARKLAVVQGSSVIPKDSVDMETLKQLVRDTGSDLAVTSRLLGVDKETQYVPGSTYYVPGPSYYGMYSYYSSSYAMVHDPGYITTYKVYKVESNVYDVRTAKLIWTGHSETTDPVNPEDGINSLGTAVINELVRMKIIK